MLPLTLSFTPAPRDYALAIRAINRRNWKRYLIPLLIWLIVWVCAILAILRGDLGDIANYFPLLIVMMVVPGAFTYATLFRPAGVVRQVMKNEQFRLPTTWQVDAEGIIIQTELSQVRHDWRVFSSYFETRDLLLLVYTANQNQVQFIPQRAFVNSEQAETLRGILQANLKP